jgi:DNA-binding MarR family transcriptional regulator
MKEEKMKQANGQAPQRQTATEPDLESRLTQRHHLSLRTWLRLLSTAVKIETEIRSRLRTQIGITLPRFDLMAQLERYPHGLRMGELSKRMMVTGGNITGIADQLEKELLVERVADINDRRSFSLRLTPDGLASFKKMARVHEQWIDDMLKGLDDQEKTQLNQLLSKVKASLP